MSITITITGLDVVQRRFGTDLAPAIKAATRAIGEEIRNRVAVYPGPARHPIAWASTKQRKWWFAHRRDLGLPFEYTRNSDPESQRLGPSWAVAQKGLGAVVGTRATYAPWVQASEAGPYGGPQSEQNRLTGWITDKTAVDQTVASGVVVETLTRAIVAALTGGAPT